MNLTPRQLDVLVAIRNYRHINGYAPTMQELADSLGTRKAAIFEHVGALERKHVLHRDKHKARSMEVIGDDEREALSTVVAEAVDTLRAGECGELATRLERLYAVSGGAA